VLKVPPPVFRALAGLAPIRGRLDSFLNVTVFTLSLVPSDDGETALLGPR
jgi:hypothetical protein